MGTATKTKNGDSKVTKKDHVPTSKRGDADNFVKNVDMLRKTYGMTFDQIGDIAGLTGATVNQYYNGVVQKNGTVSAIVDNCVQLAVNRKVMREPKFPEGEEDQILVLRVPAQRREAVEMLLGALKDVSVKQI